VTTPFSLSCWITGPTVVGGIANPMPTEPPDGEKIAVLTPMTLPSVSKLGPPGFCDAHIYRYDGA
jgi:hypothetical protein